jgi:hypothetical protein
VAYADPADPRNAESKRRHYLANRDRYREQAAARRAEVKAEATAVARAAKDVPCADCGNRYPYYVMDFDHVRGAKSANVSVLIQRGCSLVALREEIAKCDVVCANCHRERSWSRGQHRA